MQFHLNGFQIGDPDIAPPASQVQVSGDAPPAEVDVLIVGCGPAGLTLAGQLAAFPDIRTCIVEQKDGPLELGQADGIACRTMEMFNAFGFAEQVLREAYWVNETSFWTPASDPAEGIVRTGRILDTEPGLSEFPHVILNQARVHGFYLEVMRKSPTRLAPHYGRRLVDLQVERGSSDFPVTARFEVIDGASAGGIETVRARYLVGCDGSRSAVRRSIGQELRGDSANQAWGVMDVLAISDFPDIRLKSVISSPEHGSVVLIPREGGYLIRIYVEMDELDAGERVAGRGIQIEDVIGAAQRVLSPYTLDVRDVAWWSVYEIGQRLCDRFDDLKPGCRPDEVPRVFIAGDACHTHSPKAGQGMNVSMQDAFNLGWKLASVLRGRCAPFILQTYNDERQQIANELIEFDRHWAAMLSAPLKSVTNPEGIDPAEVQAHFVKSGRYTAGTATRYMPSLFTGSTAHQRLANGFPIGMRLHSAPVVRLADAKPVHVGHVVEADGRWRLLAFAGSEDPHSPASKIAQLCDFLGNAPTSPVLRYTPPEADMDSVIDLRAILQQPYRSIDIARMPAQLLPTKGRFGLVDYEKIFCADQAADIFALREIDRDAGCIVVVRPDQYVAHVLPLDAFADLASFFDAFMLGRGQARATAPSAWALPPLAPTEQ